jgi:hypothetical protein
MLLQIVADLTYNFYADRPAEIFQVIGLSRADVPTVAKAGGHHPGSQQHLAYFISRCHDEGWFSSPYATH